MYIARAPQVPELLAKVQPDRTIHALQALDASTESSPAYLHWDKLRHLSPPGDLTHEEWWLALKMSRTPLLRRLPHKDADGRPFRYAMPDSVLRLLHHVDQKCSGEIAMPEVVTADDQARRHYLVNSLMEEAIRSSQLEGASTSRTIAKELLRSGREPKDRSERMIVNHYRALQFMRESLGDKLTPGGVLELQRILTEGTLDDPGSAGRLQAESDVRVGVYDISDGSLIHQPPPASQLPDRLEALCRFANKTYSDGQFMHPAVRAIILHFWLAYDHPFEDGNGRTARTLFYWAMRQQGYWLVEYLSISHILRKAPSQYSRSFLLTETDDGDVTHFILYQLHVIERAIKELHAYLRRKVDEIRETGQLIRRSDDLNHRQLALLSDAMRHPDRAYTFQSHSSSHSVTHETARLDLLRLEQRGFLIRRKSGRRHVFRPPGNLAQRLRQEA